jgi:hypothetical protein
MKEGLIGFLKRMDAKSPDDFVEFARNNPVLVEHKIIAFLSSERARADGGEIGLLLWRREIMYLDIILILKKLSMSSYAWNFR